MIRLGNLRPTDGWAGCRLVMPAWQNGLSNNLRWAIGVFGLAGLGFSLPTWLFHTAFGATLAVGVVVCRMARRGSHRTNQRLVALLGLEVCLVVGLAASLVRRVALGETPLDCLPWVADGLPFHGGPGIGALLSMLFMGCEIETIRRIGRPLFEFHVMVALDEIPGRLMAIDAEIRAGALPSGVARLRRRDTVLRGTLVDQMESARRMLLGVAIGLALGCALPLVVHLVRLDGGWASLAAGSGREVCHLAGMGVFLVIPLLLGVVALRLMLPREDSVD